MTALATCRPTLVTLLVLVVLLCGAWGHASPVCAQPPGWSDPVVLTPDLDTLAIRPLLAADAHGRLHAIWSEGELDGAQARLHSIVYAYRDQSGWSEPVDILAASPGNSMSELKGFVVTPSNLLVVAWSEAGRIWVGQAPSNLATQVRAWRAYAVDAGFNPTLAVDEHNHALYLAYWADAKTLAVIRSDDEGDTWTDPVLVWQAGADAAGSNVVALVAQDGALHLVWAENVARRNWSAEAIWHARLDSTMGELSVREVARSPSLDDPTLDAPNIAECPDGSLHIVWNNGVGSRTGRFHQWWSPELRRWMQVQPIFPGLSGQTGKPGLVCDNTGRLHLVTAARGDERSDSGGGLRYATWWDGAWSPYETLWGGEFSGERPHMVIVGGHQLHLVWHLFYLDDQRVDLIAYASRLIDAHSIAYRSHNGSQTSASLISSQVPTKTPLSTYQTDMPERTNLEPIESRLLDHRLSPILYAFLGTLPILAFALLFSRRRSR